jgi:hypothetical protein
MLKQMADMPPGTVGFDAIGEVDDDDFEKTVEPVLRRIIAEGRKVRLLYLLGVRFREYEGDALKEEMKFAIHHPSAYERVAVVGRCRSTTGSMTGLTPSDPHGMGLG